MLRSGRWLVSLTDRIARLQQLQEALDLAGVAASPATVGTPATAERDSAEIVRLLTEEIRRNGGVL